MTRLFAIVLCIAACAGLAHDPDTLGDAIRSYNDGIRWGRYGVAAAKIPAPERSQFVEDMDERADKVKITDYDVVDVSARGSREARVRIKIGWYSTDEDIVHETHAVQIWERRGKEWFMVQESRVRGTAMPGLPEPAEDRKPEDSRTSRRASSSDAGAGQGNIPP